MNPSGPSHVPYTHSNFLNGLGRWVSCALSMQEGNWAQQINKQLVQGHTGCSLLSLSWSLWGATTIAPTQNKRTPQNKLTKQKNNQKPARQFQKQLSDPRSGQRWEMALFLLGLLSGCGFCGPGVCELKASSSISFPEMSCNCLYPSSSLHLSSQEDRGGRAPG